MKTTKPSTHATHQAKTNHVDTVDHANPASQVNTAGSMHAGPRTTEQPHDDRVVDRAIDQTPRSPMDNRRPGAPLVDRQPTIIAGLGVLFQNLRDEILNIVGSEHQGKIDQLFDQYRSGFPALARSLNANLVDGDPLIIADLPANATKGAKKLHAAEVRAAKVDSTVPATDGTRLTPREVRTVPAGEANREHDDNTNRLEREQANRGESVNAAR